MPLNAPTRSELKAANLRFDEAHRKRNEAMHNGSVDDVEFKRLEEFARLAQMEAIAMRDRRINWKSLRQHQMAALCLAAPCVYLLGWVGVIPAMLIVYVAGYWFGRDRMKEAQAILYWETIERISICSDFGQSVPDWMIDRAAVLQPALVADGRMAVMEHPLTLCDWAEYRRARRVRDGAK